MYWIKCTCCVFLLFLNCLFHYSTALPASKTSSDTVSSLNVPTENVVLKTTKRLNADNLKAAVDQSTEGLKSPPSTRKSQKKEPRIRATPTTTTTTSK
ncbi:hypothetical protein WDU94_007817 [Cyamophila willieti]